MNWECLAQSMILSLVPLLHLREVGTIRGGHCVYFRNLCEWLPVLCVDGTPAAQAVTRS